MSKILTVIGEFLTALNISIKSSLWLISSLDNAFLLSFSLDASTISLTVLILDCSKNICSVLHKPTPTAPKSNAWLTSVALSAFALTSTLLKLSAHFIMVSSPSLGFASSVSIIPEYMFPVRPSILI